jgi:hypothetical protein
MQKRRLAKDPIKKAAHLGAKGPRKKRSYRTSRLPEGSSSGLQHRMALLIGSLELVWPLTEVSTDTTTDTGAIELQFERGPGLR